MDDNVIVRRWAEAHVSRCTAGPIEDTLFVGGYPDALETIGRQLTNPTLNVDIPFLFATNPSNLWSGFRTVVRKLPDGALRSGGRQYSDVRGIVARHLYDTGLR